VWFHLHEVSSQIHGGRKLNGSWQGPLRNNHLMGTEFSFCKMKRALRMVNGDDCTTM
jgi:hypothetical protein